MNLFKTILTAMIIWLLALTYMALTANAMTVQYGNFALMQKKCNGALGCYYPATEEIFVWKCGNAELERDILNHEIGHYLTRNMSLRALQYYFWTPKAYKMNYDEMWQIAAVSYENWKNGKVDDFIINNLFKRLNYENF